MRAAVCRAFGEPLQIEEVAIAEPGPGEVHIRLAAVAICHSDIVLLDGGWGGDLIYPQFMVTRLRVLCEGLVQVCRL